MAAANQAKNLPPGIKPLVSDAFKGSMDSKIILSFIYECNLYFVIVSISNRYIQALFSDRLL